MALHQLGQDHDGDDQAVQSDGLAQGDEDQALAEGLFVLAVGCDSGRRSGSDGHAAADTGKPSPPRMRRIAQQNPREKVLPFIFPGSTIFILLVWSVQK